MLQYWVACDIKYAHIVFATFSYHVLNSCEKNVFTCGFTKQLLITNIRKFTIYIAFNIFLIFMSWFVWRFGSYHSTEFLEYDAM
jgi:hypothetical protein